MKFRVMMIVFLVFLFVVNTIPSFCQQNWPMVNGCKERTSWAADEDVLHPPLQLSAEITNPKYQACQALSCLDNIIIASYAFTPNIFFAYDAETGDTLWSRAVPESRSSVNFIAAQNDSLAFIGGQYGDGLYAVYRETGQIKWARPVTSSLYGRNPVLDENRVYVISDSLLCLDINDGSTVWSYRFSATGSPAIDDLYCYVVDKYEVIALNKLTGEIKWRKYNKTTYVLSVDEMRLFTYSTDSLIARNKTTGEIEWVYQKPDNKVGTYSSGAVAICDSFLCVAYNENADTLAEIHTLSKADGSYSWHYTFKKPRLGTPVIANGVVYTINYRSNELAGFDVGTGELLFSDTKSYLGQPGVANNKLYISYTGGVAVYENVETSIPEIEHIKPNTFAMLSAYPNPFNATTTIQFDLSRRSRVELNIYNTLGQQVAALTNDVYNAGKHLLKWNAGNLTSGIYLCRMQTRDAAGDDPGEQKVMKILLQK